MTVDFRILSDPEFEPAPIIPTSSRTVKSIGVLWYLEQSGRCLQHCRRSNRGYNNLWGKSLWLDFLPRALRVINNSDGAPRSLNTKPWISPNPSLALNSYVWLQMITSLFSWASLDIIFLLFFSRFISNWRHQRSWTFFKNGWKQEKNLDRQFSNSWSQTIKIVALELEALVNLICWIIIVTFFAYFIVFFVNIITFLIIIIIIISSKKREETFCVATVVV